ncbi:hypothetical protein LPB90_18385 [Chryseobacterium sp. LC2016-29]|uniref:hypothetical protein n=1 Tax=Chryseobacterium sp. LC2016-29 TaxID=2897331 RepID=UPI001E382D3B|nr:hypothetical protein [Chryseobacterium sp. LC2016-29]MCD0480411.1 hypothetical protein [Chryseobacterium sp. LC2016-29]
MKNYIVVLTVVCMFLVACIYFRTGYFEKSIETNESTFYIKGGDTITSKRYYRDLSGNWILLDKKIVITEDSWKATSTKIK